MENIRDNQDNIASIVFDEEDVIKKLIENIKMPPRELDLTED